MQNAKTKKGKKPKPICPRCGQEGSGMYRRYVLNSSKTRYEPYYYFAHKFKKETGGWAVRWCYLGKNHEGNFEASPERKPVEASKAMDEAEAKPKASVMAKVKGLLKRGK